MPQVKFLLYETYMSRVLDSVGTEMFRKTWCLVDGIPKDITENGEHSCAIFVSGILVMSGLLKEMHSRITGMLSDMEKTGWYEIKDLIPGAILFWEKQEMRSGWHKHSGFYIGNNKAISHRDITKSPIIHDADYASEGGRKVEK